MKPVFRPSRAVTVATMVLSTIKATTVTGGALRRTVHPTHGPEPSITVAANWADTGTTNNMVFMLGFLGIIEFESWRVRWLVG